MKTKTKTTKAVKAANQRRSLVSNRFVIRKRLVGQGLIIKYTNYDGKVCDYDHDKVYFEHQNRFDSMPCFKKRKIYTQSFSLPKFVRDMKSYI
jgi:hypothetical protein